MAAPMQHVREMFCRSLSVVFRHIKGHRHCCEPRMSFVLDQFCYFSSKQNESSPLEDFYGISESEGHETKRGQNTPRLTDNELYEKYSTKSPKVHTQTNCMNLSYGNVNFQQTQTKQRSMTKVHSKNSNSVRRSVSKSEKGNSFPVNKNSEMFSDDGSFSNETYIKAERDIRVHDNNLSENQDMRNDSNHSLEKNVKTANFSFSDMNYVDEQYFCTILERGNESLSSESQKTDKLTDGKVENDKQHGEEEPNLDFIDSQYFTREMKNKTRMQSHTNKSEGVPHKYKSDEIDSGLRNEDMNFIDQQYFEIQNSPMQESFHDRISERLTKHKSVTESNIKTNITAFPARGNKTFAKKIDPGVSEDKQSDLRSAERGHKPNTAYDVALGIRKKIKTASENQHERKDAPRLYPGPVDSKGFRILKNQVPDVMNTPSAMVVKLLKDSIIYNRDDIIAIEKPYGLPSHGGPGVHMSVGQLLPSLAQLVDHTGQLDTLHLVHRLDKQTTGVMLLAKTAEMAWQLHGAFRRREVVKKYWVLTKGVPTPEHGVIDIPMVEGTVGRFRRMALRPEITSDTRLVAGRSSVETSEAITEYRVLASHGPAALVECKPLTGVKHQIRVHLAFGLNTPILGDHKYSHFSKIAPQRLHPELLQRLGIRQSKVRHLPMMLHAKSLLLTEFSGGNNIFISSRLPFHFRINMSRLKIKPPRKDN